MGKKISQEFVPEFIDKNTIGALNDFIESESTDNCVAQIDLVAKALGSFSKNFSNQSEEQIKKLIVSFKNNLLLLIQKTWVDKSDIELKERILYQIEEFCKTDSWKWKDVYAPFLEMINNAVSLMFGQQTNSKDFLEWAFRIDPEFGIFWWYISRLPRNNVWAEDKCRISIMLGMYFLANY